MAVHKSENLKRSLKFEIESSIVFIAYYEEEEFPKGTGLSYNIWANEKIKWKFDDHYGSENLKLLFYNVCSIKIGLPFKKIGKNKFLGYKSLARTAIIAFSIFFFFALNLKAFDLLLSNKKF